ncbi:oncoprotein-induced transcript 3 protein-like, partial [Ruditapes philippinarum]|uniref:oncoprotein-induced transcript 3 protein-like n=1 Tax=Ruditapes philippinarum TaxID=129788 RepID=UPI00295AAB3A
MWVFVCFAVIFFGIQTGATTINCFSSASDVCTTEIPEIPNLSSRDPTFPMTNTTSHWTFCDVYSINTSKWYKSDARMSESCPSMYMCGTKFPIWLKGKNPEPTEGVVSRTSCLRDFDSCCLNSYELTAVNCGEFMAYCFIDLPSSCHQRYCFDNRQTSTTESQQTHGQSTSLTNIHGSTTDSFTVGTDTSPEKDTSKTKRTYSTTSTTASGYLSRNDMCHVKMYKFYPGSSCIGSDRCFAISYLWVVDRYRTKQK